MKLESNKALAKSQLFMVWSWLGFYLTFLMLGDVIFNIIFSIVQWTEKY